MLFEQPVIEQLSPATAKIIYGDLPIIVIDHPLCQAAVSIQGAQLLTWTPTGEAKPIIWLSDTATFNKGKAIRGGVPLCWPWFGSITKPAHGFARVVDWTLIALEENQDGVMLQFNLQDSYETRSLWDHSFNAIITIKLGTRCYIEFACLGDFSTTAALHSYFTVSNIKDISLSGLGRHYLDNGVENTLGPDQDLQTVDHAIDRIYTHPEAIAYLHDNNRVIKIIHHDASDVVVWNPWHNGAEALDDMKIDDYKNMICIETARIHDPLLSTATNPSKLAVTIETA